MKSLFSHLFYNQKSWFIFVSFLLVRLIYWIFFPLHLEFDTQRYNQLSDQILLGNFDLDTGAFLTAPFVPYFEAFIKVIFGTKWLTAWTLFQIIATAISGICIYQMALMLFKKEKMALFACGIFCFHPSAILYVNNVGQECFFQVFLIYSLFFLIRFLEFNDSIKNLMLSAFFFALCFLTKSYILLWSPCIALILFFRIKSTKKAIQYTLIYMILCVLMTMPYGFYNLKKHGIYTLSSNGIEFFFWFGNSESTYLSDYCIETYEKRFSEKLPTDTAFFIHSHSLPLSNMTIEKYADILKQMPPVKERQRYFKEGAKKWISENRDKWLNLKMFYLKRYILPGLNRHFFVFNRWLFMLIISVPFYFLAYWGIIEAIRKDLKKHFWILSLWVILLLFCVFFHSENRFRSITIEPYFAIYAPIGFQKMIQSLNKIRQFIKL